MLSESQLHDYARDGFVVLRGAIEDSAIEQLWRGFERNPPLDATLTTQRWPGPGRYTLANQCCADPDLAAIIANPTVTGAARDALGDEPRLSAYVIYDRTPGGPGLPPHNDYKRWRPVGSSMNWLFTIVPMSDFNAATGRLFVAPGSHRIERVRPGRERPLEVEPPVPPADGAWIDPELRRGDLLLMNMHTWHRAEGNRSSEHRVGVFNKYAAASAPPATGWYLYNDQVHAALPAADRDLLAIHDDRDITHTRLVLMDGEATRRAFLRHDGDGQWRLPGGPAWDERAIPDWDLGNLIAPAAHHLRAQVGLEVPWMSWVGDWPEGDGLCRTYAYTLTGRGFPVPYRDGEWFDIDALRSHEDSLGWEAQALAAWLDPAPIRGKGVTQAQARADQYCF